MLSLCQDICQIAFTSKLVTLFIIYPGARLNCYDSIDIIDSQIKERAGKIVKKDRFIKGMIAMVISVCLFAAAGSYPSLQTPLCGLGGIALGVGIAMVFRAFRSEPPQTAERKPYRGKSTKKKRK